jgi:uncharacterized membrane protein YjgN (DUF898 family)
MKRIKFTGSFGEYFFSSIGVIMLVIFTGGLALPYAAYWCFKYFLTRLEIEA